MRKPAGRRFDALDVVGIVILIALIIAVCIHCMAVVVGLGIKLVEILPIG